MQLLVVSYFNPPLRNSQSFQIGRLLYHMPKEHRMFGVIAEDRTLQKDADLYPDYSGKFEDLISIDNTFASRGARIHLPGIYASWYLRAYANIVRKWRDTTFDRIITFAAPMSANMLGLALKRRLKRPWVAHFSDPWADNAHMGMGKLKRRCAQHFERMVMREADTLVFTCPETHGYYVRAYPFIREKATYLEHSFDENCYREALRTTTKTLIIRHIGSLYGDRDLTTFLQALNNVGNKSTDQDSVMFEVVGNIDKKYEKLFAYWEQNAPRTITIRRRAPVSYLESLALMKESDVLLSIDMLSKNNIYLMSKLIDYLGAGRPILAIAPKQGATSRVINDVGGWLVEPQDAIGMEATLETLVQHHRAGSLAQDVPNADKCRAYSIDSHIEQYLKILRRSSEDSMHPSAAEHHETSAT